MTILFSYPTSRSGQNAWAFDHMVEHAILAGGMDDPTNSNQAIFYFLDPLNDANRRNSPWNRVHQQAHDDAANYYGAEPSPMLPLGVGSREQSWFLWNNAWSHTALAEAYLSSHARV